MTHLNRGESKRIIILPTADQFQALLGRSSYEEDGFATLADSCFRVACQPHEKRILNYTQLHTSIMSRTKGQPDHYAQGILKDWKGMVDHLVYVLDSLGLRQSDGYCILEFEQLKNYNIECFQRIDSNAAFKPLPDLAVAAASPTSY